MKRILLLPCLLLLIASGVVAQSENNPAPWKRYTVKREEFSVMLPAHPGVPAKSDASPATQATENALTIRDVDVRPFIAMKPEPAYTEEARQNQLEGTLLLKAIFSADGTINNIKVAAGLPYGLEENAIDAAKRIKFIPAMKDGKFVSTWMSSSNIIPVC